MGSDPPDVDRLSGCDTFRDPMVARWEESLDFFVEFLYAAVEFSVELLYVIEMAFKVLDRLKGIIASRGRRTGADAQICFFVSALLD